MLSYVAPLKSSIAESGCEMFPHQMNSVLWGPWFGKVGAVRALMCVRSGAGRSACTHFFLRFRCGNSHFLFLVGVGEAFDTLVVTAAGVVVAENKPLAVPQIPNATWARTATATQRLW